jgi:hypothetical protein
MEIDYKTLETLCQQLNEEYHLYEYGYHIAAVFEGNNHDEVIAWAVLDLDDQVVVYYNDLSEIEKEYGE